MLRRVLNPTAKLLSGLSEESRTNTALAKHTCDDKADLTFFKNEDGTKSYLRVTETVPPEGDKGGPSTYIKVLYEVLPAGTPTTSPILDPHTK
jgi:hypothetical protein